MDAVWTTYNLWPREVIVAEEALTGASIIEIGSKICIAPKTIKFHLTSIYRKTGVKTRAKFMHKFFEIKLAIAVEKACKLSIEKTISELLPCNPINTKLGRYSGVIIMP